MSFNNISTEVTHCFSDADEIISPEPMGIMEQKFYLHETVSLQITSHKVCKRGRLPNFDMSA